MESSTLEDEIIRTGYRPARARRALLPIGRPLTPVRLHGYAPVHARPTESLDLGALSSGWKALLYTPRTIVIGCAVTPPPIILVASRERAAQPQPGRAASEGRAYGIGVARTDTIFVKSRLNALGAKPSGNHSVDRLLLHLGGCQHVRLQPERCCAALECHVARVDAIHG